MTADRCHLFGGLLTKLLIQFLMYSWITNLKRNHLQSIKWLLKLSIQLIASHVNQIKRSHMHKHYYLNFHVKIQRKSARIKFNHFNENENVFLFIR